MEAFGGVVGIAGRGVANGCVPFCLLSKMMRAGSGLFIGCLQKKRLLPMESVGENLGRQCV
jgi:hypothetical protein